MNKGFDSLRQTLLFCRKEATRTPDPYVPNVVRCQLRYFPIQKKVTFKSPFLSG